MSNWRKLFPYKKLIALFLAAVLTVPTMPVSVYAVTNDTVVETIAETDGTTEEASSELTVVESVVTTEESGEEVISSNEETESVTESVATTEEVVIEESSSSIETTTETEAVSKEADAESSAIEETSVVATTEATTEEMTTEEETLLGELEVVGMVGIASADLIGLTGTVEGVNYTLSYTTYGDATSNYAKITGFTAADGATECAVIIPSYIVINETSIPVTEIAANVFKNKTCITQLLHEEDPQLTTIGDSAFYGCSYLTYVDLPDSLTSIGFFAFQGATALGFKDRDGNEAAVKELVLPAGLKTISSKAFKDCDSLEKVIIPVSIESVQINNNNEASPFHTCDNLETIILQEGMTYIPSNLFNGDIVAEGKELVFTIPASVTKINSDAFGYNNMQKVIFPENSMLTEIGDSAFEVCDHLSYINIPETVTSIGIKAFSGDILLGSKDAEGNDVIEPQLTLPENLKTLSTKAFEGCISYTSVIVPKHIESVPTNDKNTAGPFYCCDNMKTVVLQEGMLKIPNNLFEGHIVPTDVDEFGEFIYTTEFTIPDSVTVIESRAFYNQTNMTGVHFSENSSLKTIGDYAFYNASLMEKFNLPDTVETIGEYAFRYCNNLNEFNISDTSSLTTIGALAFYACTNLKYINLLEGIQDIGERAFAYIPEMFTIDENGNTVERPVLDLPNTLTTIGFRAFAGNTSIKEIYIPKSLKKYNAVGSEVSGAFYNCTQLEEIVFEEGIEEIPSNLLAGDREDTATVEGCSYIDIVFPASLKSIPSKLFVRNLYIRSVSFAENSKLQSIGSYAFAKCKNFKSIEFPDSLKTISWNAFESCALENVVIPKYVTSIGEKAFIYCNKLESVEFEVNNYNWTSSQTQSLGEEIFNGCTSLKNVKLGNKIYTIPKGTFYNCKALEEIVFSHGITTIEKNVFFNCESLRTIFIPASVTSIKISPSELAYCYEQGLKIYVEKGDSTAKTFAETNGYPVEVGIYATEDEFTDSVLLEQMRKQSYDKNLDTRLTLRELEQIVNVDLSGLGIKDMTGTQLFTSMETLDCSDNDITELDISTWKKLTSLDCSSNKIKDLDFTNNPIETLDCGDNCILVFDLNDIETLTNVTLGVQNGRLAVEEDTSRGFFVLPLPTEYPSYIHENVTNIFDEDAQKNRYGIVWQTAYDVPDHMQYRYTTTYGTDSELAEAIVNVSITNAGIEISNKEYPDPDFRAKINELVDTNKNGLISKTEERGCTKLDVSGTEGYEISDLTGVERLVNLTDLICKNNELTALDVSKNTKLVTLDCSNNQIVDFSIGNKPELISITCNDNKIKEVNTSTSPALVELICTNNKITKLDLSSNLDLEVLDCVNNALAAIDLSKNDKLSEVFLGKQNLTLLIEEQDKKTYARIRNYDPAFDSNNVSNVVVYNGEEKDTSGEYIQLTEEGFVIASEITKVEYNYTTPDLGKLMVTMNLVSELEEEEEIILKDIADLDINAFVTKIYTGEETFQNIVINDGTYMLREYVDYKVTYRDNIEVGTAKVEIEGIGNYRGSYENTYEIVNEWNVTIKAIKDQTYQNKKLEPKLTVKDGRKTLRAGIDYKAEYLNNKNTGVATVVVTGFGNYAGAGMKEITFNIVECKISKVSFAIDSVTYNGTAQEPVVTAIHNKAYIKEGKDFKTSYSKNVKAGKGTVTITGIGNYTGTVKKTFIINKINLKELSDNDITIDGPAKYNVTGGKVGVTVRSGDYQLVEGKDYTLSYSKNKAVGKAKVTIKGKGSCTNKVIKEFEIKPQSIDDASIHIDVAIAQVDKNGKALKPKVTVTQNKKKLREGENKDYVISYDETATTKKGSYTVTIYGKNNFGGSEEGVKKDFIIVEHLINKAKVKGLENWEYDGSEKEQFEEMIDVMIGNTEVPPSCYELTYNNNVNVGTAVITVTADPTADNYEYEFGGSTTATFKINAVKFKPSKTEERVTAEFQDVTYLDDESAPVVTYTGNALMPQVVVYDEELGTVLTEGEDYTVTYKNNVNVGTKASATIKGIKNYSGSITLNFAVVKKDMNEYADDFKVSVKNSAYAGKNIKPRVIVWDGDTVLKLNKDYVLHIGQYIETDDFNGNIKDKGLYIITIEGKGNYTGELDELYYLSVY